MYKIPEKLNLANLPTKITKLQKLSESLNKNIYIKRDDETGIELSGNKVRKLEYSIKEALNQGATTLITCGGIQSNHARATTVAATKLGLKSILVLREPENAIANGNHLLDKLVGADIRFVSASEYATSKTEIMKNIQAEVNLGGNKAYIIPEGASNGIGLFGYINAISEIKQQEASLGVKFDAIVSCVGSSGTYGGLVLGSKIFDCDYDIIGVNICENAPYFKKRCMKYIIECCTYLGISPENLGISENQLLIADGHAGLGYAQNSPEDFEFIKYFASLEGIFLDPVYTGKTLKGLCKEIELSNNGQISQNPDIDFSKYENILFIHTGGLYGLFPKSEEMNDYI